MANIKEEIIMKQIVISNKKATRTHLIAGIVALLLLVCVHMDNVLALAQVLVPTSSMVGQEIFMVLAIVGLWYMVWGCIVLSLVLRISIRLMAMYIGK